MRTIVRTILLAGLIGAQFLTTTVNAQECARFKKIIGDPNVSNSTSCINVTFDHGYILGGWRYDGQVLSSYLVKTDSLGNVQWTKEYFYSNLNFIADVIQTRDSGYLFTGSANNSTQWYDMQLIKTDEDGNIEWSYTYNTRFANDWGSFGGCKIIEDTNSYYILGGFWHSPGDPGALVLNIDYSGNLLHSNVLYTPFPSTQGGHGYASLIKLSNGNFAAEIPYVGNWEFVFTFDAQCNLISSYSYYDPTCLYSDPLAISESSNGNLMLFHRTTDSSGYDFLNFSEITTNGGVIYSYRYDLPGRRLGRVTATITSDKNILVSGSTADSTNYYRMFSILFDENGNVMATEIDSGHYGEGYEMIELSDGSFVGAVTYQDSLPISVIIKYDMNLNTACDNNSFGIAQSSNPMSANGSGYASGDVIVRENLAAIAVSLDSVTQTLCFDFIDLSTSPSPDLTTPEWFVPNAFTPNADGLNDIFMPAMYGEFTLFHFLIFDRWGELIFESSDPNQGWDGTYESRKCQLGVYVWRIAFADASGQEQQHVGHVTLLR